MTEQNSSSRKPKRADGEGTLEQLKDGRWRARITVRLPDGRKTRRAFTAKTRKEVVEKVRAAAEENQEEYAAALRKLRDNRGHRTNVYFVRARSGGLIKIGKAVNVANRLALFQMGSPVPLEVVAVVRKCHPYLERRLHNYFAAHRVRGEWFAPSLELLRLIGQLREGGSAATTALDEVVEAEKREMRRISRGELIPGRNGSVGVTGNHLGSVTDASGVKSGSGGQARREP